MAFTPFRDMTPAEQAVWDRITGAKRAKNAKALTAPRPKSDPNISVHDEIWAEINARLIAEGQPPRPVQLLIDTDNDTPGWPSNTEANYARLRQAQIEAAAEGIPLLLDKGFRLARPGPRLG